jgi:hypothetical protein
MVSITRAATHARMHAAAASQQLVKKQQKQHACLPAHIHRTGIGIAAGHFGGRCMLIAVPPPGPQRIIAQMLGACGIQTDRSQHQV